jgi:hypothetical protein
MKRGRHQANSHLARECDYCEDVIPPGTAISVPWQENAANRKQRGAHTNDDVEIGDFCSYECAASYNWYKLGCDGEQKKARHVLLCQCVGRSDIAVYRPQSQLIPRSSDLTHESYCLSFLFSKQ